MIFPLPLVLGERGLRCLPHLGMHVTFPGRPPAEGAYRQGVRVGFAVTRLA
jgi:hypothetical protein